MELKRYAALILKQWWIVAAVAAVAVVVAFGISKAMRPVFKAQVTLGAGASVGGNGNASEYISLQGGLLSKYAVELSSLTLADKVSNALKLDIPPQKLKSEIKAVPTTQDLTITVAVEDTDGNRAKAIANKLADLFVQNQQDQATKAAAVLGGHQDIVLVSIIDPALTADLIRPKTKVNMVVAGILGVTVGILVVFLVDWLDDTVRTPEEAELLLDTRTLAAIPRLQRTKRKATTPRIPAREDSISTVTPH